MSYNVEVVDFSQDEINRLKKSGKSSNWFVTINTQQRVANTDPFVEIFYYSLDRFLRNIDEYISTREGYPTTDNRSVKIRRVIEIGPETGCLHSHVNIEVKHNSNIRLEIKRIREYFISDLGLTNIHLDVKIYNSSTLSDQDKILKYMLK